MKSSAYSSVDQFIHRLYLCNNFVSKTSFDIEQTIYKKEISQFPLKEIVFVTGLARAGTTALFNAIYATDSFASLTYGNMPFLLMPIIWKQLSKNKKPTELIERAHQDGIKVNSESPEEFDEYFWKTMLNNQFIKTDFLDKHIISNETLTDFDNYMKAVCLSSKKSNYLSKNNNNVLRIPSLLNKFPSANIILVYRDPLEHAKSLLKQHQKFCLLQKTDPFALEYFNYLGHHEFGLNQKHFKLNEENKITTKSTDINYWLINWLNYYTYILSIANEKITFISFDDLCNRPNTITAYLNRLIEPDNPIVINENYTPKQHDYLNYNEELKKKCDAIYTNLNCLRKYAS